MMDPLARLKLSAALPLAVLVLGTLVAALPARAAQVAFVEASSERGGSSEVTAWHATDGKNDVAWCSSPEDTRPTLSFGFDEPVTVTHLGLVGGAYNGATLAKGTRRAQTVVVEDLSHQVELTFRGAPQMQVIEIKPPMKGKRITLFFRDAGDDEDGSDGDTSALPPAPLCVGEVLLKSKDVALTGAQVSSRLRTVSPAGRKLLHEWLDDPSAPQRILTFHVDGTFAYSYAPYLEGKPVSMRGKWSAADRTITLEVGGKPYRLNSRLTVIDGGEQRTTELVLEGSGPHASIPATYRPAPARLR